MLKNDYMEEVENTLKLIRKEVDRSLVDGEIDEVLERINKEVKALVGLDMDTINSLAFTHIIDILRQDNQYNAERYIALGELLYFQGNLYKSSDEDLAFNYYTKALRSFYEAYSEEDYIEEKYLEDCIKVTNELSQYEMPVEESLYMITFYKEDNEFDKAEDVLFSIIKQSNNDEEIIKRGIEFYKSLMEKDEDILEQGNLPLSEIKESLEELESMILQKREA